MATLGKILSALGQFFGQILKHIMPQVIEEVKQPDEIIVRGNCIKLKKDIEKSIEDEVK